MREQKLVCGAAVMRHQKPARQSLLELTVSVGQRRVGSLHREDVNVTQQSLPYGLALAHGIREIFGRNAMAVTFDLDEDLAR
jgi:hypothetical protein